MERKQITIRQLIKKKECLSVTCFIKRFIQYMYNYNVNVEDFFALKYNYNIAIQKNVSVCFHLKIKPNLLSSFFRLFICSCQKCFCFTGIWSRRPVLGRCFLVFAFMLATQADIFFFSLKLISLIFRHFFLLFASFQLLLIFCREMYWFVGFCVYVLLFFCWGKRI